MNQSLIRMAKQASDNASLMASLIRRYGEKKGISWEAIAKELRIDSLQMARLALCRTPSRTSYAEDIAQIADYVGMNRALLQRLVRQREEAPANSGLVARWRALTEGVSLMFTRRTWAFGIAALILLIVGAVAFAQPRSTDATLVVSKGSAIVSQSGASVLAFNRSEISLSAGEIASVNAGDRIVLGPGSSAQLRLFDGSTVDIYENSTLDVTSLYTTEESYRVGLNMLAGKTVSRVIRLLSAGDAFRISTPSSTASVRGTIFTVEVIDADTTLIACDEGVVRVAMGRQTVEVVAGTEVTAVVGETMEVETQPDFVPPGQPEDSPPVDPLDDESTDSPGRSGEAPGQTGAAPGLSGEAPGNSGEAPGQSGEAPGQSGAAPGRGGLNPGHDDVDPPGRSFTPPGHTRRNSQNPVGEGGTVGASANSGSPVGGGQPPGLAKKGWEKGAKAPPGQGASDELTGDSGTQPSSSAPGQTGEHPQGGPPGQSGENPGQGDPPDSPPGQEDKEPASSSGNSGTPPGQDKKP